MEFFATLEQHPEGVKVLVSLVILLLIGTGRRIAVRTFDRSGLPPERRNRFMVQSRNAAIVLFLVAVTVLWAEQLQTVALSLAALAAALVIATKELILCISGTFLRMSARTFRLGDRISVDGTRGDVIDIGPLTTTLLEVGPGPTIHKLTGRTVVLPNSLFLTYPVVNETFTEQYVLHTTTLEFGTTAGWREAETLLLEVANEACSSFVEEAEQNMRRVGHKHGLEPPNVTPRVWVAPRDPGIALILRFPAPIRGAGQVEQAILRAYLDRSDGLTTATSGAARPEA